MKKTFLAVLLSFIPVLIYSQTLSGVWDKKTARYINTAHNITWQLIEELDWVERPIVDESTLLKVRNYDTQILVSLGADRYEGDYGDSWDYISEIESQQKALFKQLSDLSGMENLETKAVKSQLCGIHAIKTRSDSKIYHPEYKQNVHYIEITYGLYHRGYIYTISIAAFVLEDEIVEFNRVATAIFNGFKIQ